MCSSIFGPAILPSLVICPTIIIGNPVFLASLIKIPVASLGTLGVQSKNYKKKTKLTSIDPVSLHKNLNILAKRGIKYVILIDCDLPYIKYQ